MRVIAVKIQQYEVAEWTVGRGPAAEFQIDGIPMVSFLARLRPELNEPSGSRSPYGRWIGIEPRLVLPPSRNFLGDPNAEFEDEQGRVPIAACSECGMHWCDGIWTRILVEDSIVRWTDFIMNPSINPIPLPEIGELTFDRTQYHNAFSSLR